LAGDFSVEVRVRTQALFDMKLRAIRSKETIADDILEAREFHECCNLATAGRENDTALNDTANDYDAIPCLRRVIGLIAPGSFLIQRPGTSNISN
jgi:hypothetical protein